MRMEAVMQRTMLHTSPPHPLRRQADAWLRIGVLCSLVLTGISGRAADSSPRPPAVKPPVAARPMPIRPAPRATGRSANVDHAVVSAGGADGGNSKCVQCSRAACPQCRLDTGLHKGHKACPHGLCPAHCPVRPDVFGFYGTQWRKWPGSGVVQASNIEAVTPSPPPEVDVPGPLEESPQQAAPAEALPAPETPPEQPAAQSDADAPRRNGIMPKDGDRAVFGEPPAKRPAAEMPGNLPPEDAPPAEPPISKPKAPVKADAFDGAASGTSWRSFTAAAHRPVPTRDP